MARKVVKRGAPKGESQQSPSIGDDEFTKRIADAMSNGLRVGDSIALTHGKETFPVDDSGATVEVGPIQVTLMMRDGDSPSDFYLRARELAEVLFQAEYAMKIHAYKMRLKEVRSTSA